MRTILENTWPVLKSIKVMKNMAREKWSETRGDQGDLTTKCNEVSWVGFWAKKVWQSGGVGGARGSVVKILVKSDKVWSSVVKYRC